MSAATPLPPRPRLEHYRKRAKNLVKACRAGDRDALRGAKCTLANAQLLIARDHRFASWPKFAKHVEGLTRARSPISRFEKAVDAIVAGDAAALARLLREDRT